MANIQLSFSLNSQISSSLSVTVIDCLTNVNYISQYIVNTTQTFSNLQKGENIINFQVSDGTYSLSNFKFRLFLEGVYYETQCTSKEINCGATCIENYVLTGEYRCVQLNGSNTGQKEVQKIDLNSFCTGNQEIWIDGGQDFINCPLVTTLTPDWDNSRFERVCLTNGKTKFKAFVKNTGGNIVEFLWNNVWSNANVGTDGFEFIEDSDGVCKDISFRLKGTTNERWGCYQSLTPEQCSVQSELSSGTIQLKVYQECQTKTINGITYSGVFLKVVPFTPVSDINKFTITWSRDITKSLTAPITQLSTNEWVLENNVIQEATGINVTVSNSNDSFTCNLWSNTCNHDGMPLSCNDNNRDVILDKTFYNIGDTLNATANSYSPCGFINWYNTNITGSGNATYTGVVNNFPVILHAQPLHNNNTCKQCHGWTEVYLRQNSNTPVSSLKNIYVNLYPTGQEVYDGILNKFTASQNRITEIYSDNELNLGAKIYINSSKTQLYGSGYMAFFQGNTLKKFKLQNGVIVEGVSDVISNITSVTGTKVLAPFKHYMNGQFTGIGYAAYDSNTKQLSYWDHRLQIASDGLTITDLNWNNGHYWVFNKQLMTVPLVNWKVPLEYVGTIVEIMVVRMSITQPQFNNVWAYTIKIGK